MKKYMIFIFWYCYISTAFAQNGEITVAIKGFEKIEGQVAIGLYSDSKSFPEISKAYKGVFLPVNKNNIQHTLSSIPYGDYAIAVFHDNNSNQKLDTSFFGMPTEKYGFSNNTSDVPNFTKAKFTFYSNQTINIHLEN